jgi:hypothetical protein
MEMKEARRPTTAFSASIMIHFFSTSAGFSEAVVFSMGTGPLVERGPEPEVRRADTTRDIALST